MSLWSVDPDKFAETDFQLEQWQRREEWPLLHGDGEPEPEPLDPDEERYRKAFPHGVEEYD